VLSKWQWQLENLELELIFFRVPKKNRGASNRLVTPLNHSNGFSGCNLLGYNIARPETVCPCRTDTPRLVLWVASPCPQLDTSESERINGSKPRTKGIRPAVPHKTVITPQGSRRCHRPYVVLSYTTLYLPHRTASIRGVQGNLIYDGRGRAKSHKEGALGENHFNQGRKGRASRQPAGVSSRVNTGVIGCQPGAERPTDRERKRTGEKRVGERLVFYTVWVGFSAH